MNLHDLSPQTVWSYFGEICRIPRPSKKEEKIIAYLLDFAKKHKLEAKKDKVGNVLIRKPATKGMEKKKTIVLQSHTDMVCEKNSDVDFNFETDPIEPYVEGDWVKAQGTTLGADDGIGVATQLAILASDSVEHGELECLFTADEETGMTGAFGLKPNFFKGKTLINLDSEDEGELFIGCAGGMDTRATFDYRKGKVPRNSTAFRIFVKGLQGGHSGDEIDKGLGNSVKILARLLWHLDNDITFRLAWFEAGNLRNAIAREGVAEITMRRKHRKAFLKFFEQFSQTIKQELAQTEPKLELSHEEAVVPEFVINRKTQRVLLNALYACPHGVLAMSRDMPGMVETSTNLASVKMKDKQRIEVGTSQRSALESAKIDAASMVESVFLLAGAKVQHSDGYPGWAPDVNSEIMKITESAYKRLFKTSPVVRSIHAGLECGLFLQKYPDLDMISFGPTIKGAHSPDERISIETTQKFWELLLEVLKNAPEK